MGDSTLDKHPRILIITDNLKDQINGVAVTFKNLANEAKNSGYEMHFLDPSEFFHFSAPFYKEIKLAIPFGIARKIESIQPDYIHIATEGPIGLAAKLYCDRNNLKYNTSYHTRFPEYLETMFNIPVSISYRYFRWFHKHSGIVLTTTKGMCDALHKNGLRGKIIPWTRGIDRSLIRKKERFKYKVKKPNVLYVGRISPEKNIEALLRYQYDFNIIIVGDGPQRKKLEQKYLNVDFVGYKTGTELFDYYIDADVFCFPSKTDAFGIVMIEAMACGTPVAAFPVEGPIDVVEHGKTGILDDDIHKAIKQCLKLNRSKVMKDSMKWSWNNCWKIFESNLLKANEQ